MGEIAKALVLMMIAGIFVYALKKDWEGVVLIFGAVLLLGSCHMLGI